ncbi:MAG TPA: S46 family peptidase [Bacteroidales bacterium]|nr:S46 family peptidase [Bacteroidales bacterium]
MRKLFLALSFAVLLGGSLRADEGMWLPMLVERLNYTDMQKMGLQLTPEEIYSVNHSSLKDAIIIFGRGCTGEMISGQGLVLTNHHCGYGAIQANSSVEHDYLTDGFWARSLQEELKNEGLTAKFLVRMEDVSARVLEGIRADMSETDRAARIKERSAAIEKEATEGTHYDAVVKDFFYGNEYYLFVYETFKDVRLVGAPPSSIGKFGYDTDNWMWPRHTGDFSLFRIYAGPDGKPADYSTDNVPLRPKHFLPVSMDGVKKGDFAMIMGNPGSTSRYMTSYGIQQNLGSTLPTRIKIREKKLEILKADMDASAEVRIKYASKYAGISNYWKNFIGMSRGLKRLRVYDDKKALEDQFSAWVNASPDRKAKYGEALTLISKGYSDKEKYNEAYYYFIEAIASGAEIMRFSKGFEGLAKALESGDQAKVDAEKARLKGMSAAFFKDYHQPTDQKIMAAMLEMYHRDVEPDQQPAILKSLHSKYKGDWAKYAAKVFSSSAFSSPARVDALLAKPSAKAILKDPALQLVNAFYEQFFEIRKLSGNSDESQARGYRLFVAGLREMQPDKKFYPDANFTMRLTYGTVQDYFPADAVHYDYYTTLDGVMEKEDPDNYEFHVPKELKALWERKDFGAYGNGDDMWVCFLTTHDITGGNSGSPVLNGKGELIGLAFDGNWEAMSGDIAFEPELQRTINVDIRYVLFIIDKFAGAQNIMSELKLVSRPRVEPSVPQGNAEAVEPAVKMN